jgi:general secretion pathway protein M
MSVTRTIARYLAPSRTVSALIYAASVAAFVATIIVSVLAVIDRTSEVNSAADVLARLDGAAGSGLAAFNWTEGSVPNGSPFLEGQTVTIASAALLRRISGAISSVGGNLTSSEVAPHDPQSQDGYVRVIVNCELDQIGMQRLLYDLEAGMPFLFVDQLAIEAPPAAGQNTLMRMTLAVSGYWPRAK